jgi:hypothetical protein
MRKLLWGVAGLALIAAAGAAYLRYTSLDQSAERAIEREGSQAAGTRVEVARVRIAAADGSGVVSGLSVANPPGSRTPAALFAKMIRITVELDSVRRDPVVIRTIAVESPRISYEPGDKGSNLAALLDNIQRQVDKPGRRIIVDRLIIRDARLSHASPGDPNSIATVNLPEIRLSNLGRETGGITPAHLARSIAEVLIYQARRAVPPAPPPAK